MCLSKHSKERKAANTAGTKKRKIMLLIYYGGRDTSHQWLSRKKNLSEK